MMMKKAAEDGVDDFFVGIDSSFPDEETRAASNLIPVPQLPRTNLLRDCQKRYLSSYFGNVPS